MVANVNIYHKQTMLLKILTDDHPLLREKSQAVNTITAATKQLVKDLTETMNYGSRAVGIAAPQVGILERIIICKLRNAQGKNDDVAMINPQIITHSTICEIGEEGCLSIPNIFGPVKRPREITVQYATPDKKQVLKRFVGFNARVIQHEIDHLEGILFTDLVTNKEELFEELNF